MLQWFPFIIPIFGATKKMIDMRGLVLVVVFCLLSGIGRGQQAQVINIDEGEANKMASLPKLTLPQGYSLKSLPALKDNSATKYFPEVFMQNGWSCNQASSVGYLFTYEINALRDLPSTSPNNLYPPSHVWNLLNRGNAEQGVSYFDSWEVIRTNGIPSFAVYGQDLRSQRWLTGYENYYLGMHNRTDQVYNIYVGDPDGLNTLKHWLNDHMDGSPNGGLANFQIASGGMKAVRIPAGLPEEDKFIMLHFGQIVGHAMTFVGWNDSVRHDFNDDGLFTNDIDITGDGIVDMRDWEVGALLAVNSWGSTWPADKEEGRCYIPYRLLAFEGWEGGVWGNLVTVMRPKKEYSPLLTIKGSVTHTARNQIKIVAGVAQNFAAQAPEMILEYPFFNFLGGDMAMQGISGAGTESLEFGLDITPLLNYINPNLPAKFFLDVYHRENENQNGNGKVDYFSIMDYGGETVVEEVCPETNVGIKLREITRLTIIYDPVAKPVVINTTALPDANVGVGYSHLLQAGGGNPPYTWSNGKDQYVAQKVDERWDFPFADKILGISDTSRQVVDIGFSFPFYGEVYDKMTVLKNGGIVMGDEPKDYPYVIDPRAYIFQNAGIYPLYAELQYAFGSDGVYRLDEDDCVTIAWDATLAKENRVYDPKFGVKIWKDGRIETGYYTTSISAEWSWIAGVSAGDMKTYTLPEINNLPIMLGGFRVNYSMNDWPSWLYFSDGGALLGVPEDGASRVFLPISVTDANGLYQNKVFNLQIHGTSGVDGFETDSNIQVFPNPFTNRLSIKFENIKAESLQFDLFNIAGQKVYSKQFTSGSHAVEINLSEVEGSGNFFYQIKKGNKLYSGKVVRQ